MKTFNARKRANSGFTLLEVLIGILIFAIGMMALAKLQGNLARNSGDANARTVATNIAEETIEAARTFSQITSDGANAAYNDIVDSTDTIPRAGNLFEVDTDVTDYYVAADGSYSTTAPAGATNSDMKLVEMTVSWGGTAFEGAEADDPNTMGIEGQLGSGSITITDVISSITSPSGGKVILGTNGTTMTAPPVNYNPGANPEIVSIELGANKFKESTKPLPVVYHSEDLVETTFDVVTYSQDDAGATFLRREEFKAVSCECTLRAPSTREEGGLRPTIWEGYEYTEAEFVSKPYGEVTRPSQQSQLCDLCCRDHHDGGTGSNDRGSDPGRSRYDPFRPSNGYVTSGELVGDHKHYGRDGDGMPVLAEDPGDSYDEACRLVRKDGFYRVAQDLRQEGLNAFPGDYLDADSEVDEYSRYVTRAVSLYQAAAGNGYETAIPRPTMTPPADMDPAVEFPASTEDDPTVFSNYGTTEQQLRSRGIYIDYMTDVLRGRITCLEDDSKTGADCDVPDVTSPLEIIPFYDVQLTQLARWNESPENNPVDVTNESVDNRGYSRGWATLETGYGSPVITSATHTGNLGLTGTDPIDPWYLLNEEIYSLYALAVDYNAPPPVSLDTVAGTISSAVGGLKASDVSISAAGAQCDRTNTGFECHLEIGAQNPRLTVSNYEKANKYLIACSDVLEVQGQEHVQSNSSGNWTRFTIPLGNWPNANIVIKEGSTCD